MVPLTPAIVDIIQVTEKTCSGALYTSYLCSSHHLSVSHYIAVGINVL